MQVLLVDNYDSFTFNLFQALARFATVQVVPNDQVDGTKLYHDRPDAVVISPGPGRPDRPSDVAGSRSVIDAAWGRIPLIGVCLGHQLLGIMRGCRLARAPRVRHGKVSRIRCGDDPMFDGLPRQISVMRYHSWCLDRLPPEWQCVARAEEDGVVMAMRHRRAPAVGLQFHPESVGTPTGVQMLANVLRPIKARGEAASPML